MSEKTAPIGPTVQVRIGTQPFTTTVIAGSHTLTADEPTSLGGQDHGPDPYDLLLASLGSCAAITMRMYANRKGWPLEEVRIDLRHFHQHAEDCANCEEAEPAIHHIEKSLTLVGPLTPEQKQRLHQIADRCPVQKTLEGQLKIVSIMAG